MTTPEIQTEPKPLELEIQKNRFLYRQEKRSDKAFIYRQIDKPEDGPEHTVGFEVFRRMIQKPSVSIMGGIEVVREHKEKFPSNESFGVWAWSYRSLERAIDKFNELNGE